MRVLFISKSLHAVSGAGVGSRMHLNALKRLVGEENVYVVDVGLSEAAHREEKYIAYGKYHNILDRLHRHLEGNTYLFSNKIISDVCKIIKKEKVSFVFVDDSYYGNLVKTIKKECDAVTVVTFFHDVKAALFRIWMKTAPWFDKIDFRIGLAQEKISTMYTDANIVLNQNENSLLRQYYNVNADFYFPVCVSGENKQQIGLNPYCGNKRHILFVGTYYLPNIQGLHWFCDTVFDSVKENYDIWVIGKGLEKVRDEFNDDDIHVIGFVDSLSEYYSYADMVIAPLTDGGGMKIKTAEAISYGKMFLGSSESLYGYWEEIPDDLKGKVVFKCDTAEEYLKAFNKIDGKPICKKNEELITLYDRLYSENAAYNIMKDIVEKTTGVKL